MRNGVRPIPGVGLFNYLTSEVIEYEEASPEPESAPEQEQESVPNVIYAEPIAAIINHRFFFNTHRVILFDCHFIIL